MKACTFWELDIGRLMSRHATEVRRIGKGFVLCLAGEKLPSTRNLEDDDDEPLPARRDRKQSLSAASSTPQSQMAHAEMMDKRKEQGDFWVRRGSSAMKGKRNSLQSRRVEVADQSDKKKRLSILQVQADAASQTDADRIHMAAPSPLAA